MTLTLRIANTDIALSTTTQECQWFQEAGTIGRGQINHWVLSDTRSEISRIHAKIHYENNDYYIEDMSTNGVFVGEDHRRIVDKYRLQTGDSIIIGPYHIATHVENTDQQAGYNEGRVMPDIDAQSLDKFARELDIETPINHMDGVFEVAEPPAKETLEMLHESVASPYIPEDWDGGAYGLSVSTSAQPSAIPSSSGNLDNNINNSQKKAVFKALDTLLNHFDSEYVKTCLSIKGGKNTVFEQVYNDVFEIEYLHELEQSE